MAIKKAAKSPRAAQSRTALPPSLRSLASAILGRYQFMRQAGLTFDGARDLYATLGYSRFLTNEQYREEYARGGIATRIVEAYPKATWRGGAELQEDEDPNVTTTFEEAWDSLNRRLNIWSVLQRTDILAGLSTYSVLLLGVPGDLDQEIPRGTPDKLLYLAPFSGGGGPDVSQRQTATITDYMDATIDTLDTDITSARYGLPVTYRLRRLDASSPAFTKPVHWSRIIHVAEGTLDNEVYGVPVLESVWNLLQDLQKTTGGGAEAFWLRANQGLQIDIDPEMELSPTAETALKEEVEEYKHNISRVMKTRGATVKTLGSDTANFSSPADAILTQIAGAKGIPKRILMGSEMGQLASGQDADNFNTQVQDRRTGYAGPRIVRQLVDRLIKYGYLPKPKQYEVVWPTVEMLTETEKAEGANKWALTKTADGKAVFTADEIRRKWYRMEPLTKEQIAAMEPPAPEPAPADPTQPEIDPETGKPVDDKAPIDIKTGKPVVKAAQTQDDDEATLRELEMAIEQNDTATIDRICGITHDSAVVN